jgi:hypothetical protein
VDQALLISHPLLSQQASATIGTTVEIYEDPATGAFLQHLPFVGVNVFVDQAAWQASVANIVREREAFVSDPLDLLGDAFPTKVEQHLRTLQQRLGLPFDSVTITPAVVAAVDKRVRREDYRTAFPVLFPLLVAFIGEALRQELNGRWAEGPEVVILAAGKTYNPYRDLFEAYVERTVHLNIGSLLLAERQKYILSDQTRSGDSAPPQ